MMMFMLKEVENLMEKFLASRQSIIQIVTTTRLSSFPCFRLKPAFGNCEISCIKVCLLSLVKVCVEGVDTDDSDNILQKNTFLILYEVETIKILKTSLDPLVFISILNYFFLCRFGVVCE